MPGPRQPQVSMSFFLPHIDSTDIIEAERAHLGPLRAAFSPSLEGVKNWKNLNRTQSRHTIVSPFWAFVPAGIHGGLTFLLRRHVYLCLAHTSAVDTSGHQHRVVPI